ncbi:MAG TPA: rhodanese [Pusillimonas sp.]|jgi:rhodanese-related sulfurtransferase|nr:rhodanese [Pusillimonas sp.]HCN71701.1 rhodanese [Pusillimonas sp.]|tara:strand:+ start:389 stop:739 length:351 start_codon:yes stop_codon:yes gene_type:complete
MLLWPAIMKGTRASAVGVSQAVQLANQNNGVFIDVRSHEKFKGGSIPQAKNIPAADIEAKMSTLPKDKPIIIVCEHGRESATVAGKLRKNGFSEAVALEGGLRKWIDAGMPVSGKH